MAASIPVPLAPDSGILGTIDTSVNGFMEPIATAFNDIVFFPLTIGDFSFPIVVAWLIIAGVVITCYFGFIQFRGLRVSAEVVRGKFSTKEDPGEVPHFQALTSALSGTVGLGNIAGVGAAMALGGPGATFWMILAGLLGMATKFAECTLGVKYREVHEDGTVSGGPFKYLPVAFQRFGSLPAKVLTGVFAVAILLFGVAGGNMFQANQTFAQVRNATGGEDGLMGSDGAALLFGLILAVLVAVVILGGIKSIGATTSKLVPAMAAIYILACGAVIAVNLENVPAAFGAIIEGAFRPEGFAGGILGVMIVGFQRASFSNEAGVGSAAIAHSAVKTRRPVSEGFVAMFEPLVDTVLICTMTALAIVMAGAPSLQAGIDQVQGGGGAPDGVILTSDAFATVLPWFPIVLAVAVALFAYSTLITWSYYGLKAWEYVFGRGRKREIAYKVIFLTFTVAGCILSFSQVISFTDAALFICAFVNLLGVYLLLPVIKREMKAYLADRKSGKLDILGIDDEDIEDAAPVR
ncbi:alanine/glycine:cation symporter family protein [Arthrobacter caoxuetaonis]|uniref:alanine/glycine:cation symporter family protein n=1 Tax=Arthrobacter caoxuetaonis TaxID=2886935 RepID=UPI001D13CBE5|nr:alanine/glycine:cation symporter family protein [Arthrobacter caoxuetaonis]MCC3281924.1 alanine:cation symporter family protein [Arthrobacter caoxuetaonis]MCC3283037.1 alanine:cation symporter family protein [Arthrobacter caoxuetaonis]